jgi:hypothetical protein
VLVGSILLVLSLCGEAHALGDTPSREVEYHLLNTGHRIAQMEVDVSAEERDALVVLYEATDGDNWDNNENWLTEAPVDEWFGVEVEGGNVVELVLRSNNLDGELPLELAGLSALTVLQLQQNNLTGTIPSWLGELQELRWLALWENEFIGTIPSELGELTNLEVSLGLGSNNLTGEIPPELGQLVDLQLLGLDRNNLEGEIPAELGQLTELTGLWLHFNALEGGIPSEFGNLITLDDLRVNNNNLGGPLPIDLTTIPSDQVENFWFDETNLCEPPDDIFQEWLSGIEDVRSTGEICDPAAPVMVLDPDALDFGTVPVGETERESFTVTNEGNAVLTGAVENPEAPFAVVEGGGAFELEPEESVAVTVEYAPEEESGLDTGEVVVSSDAVDNKAVALEGRAEAIRELAVAPGSLDFGTVAIGEASREVFTITNEGNVVLSGAVENPEAPFAVVEGGGAFELEPEESVAVTVEYAPEEESGLDSGEVVVSSDAVDNKAVALEGRAEAVPPLRISLQREQARQGEPLEVEVVIEEGNTDIETAVLHYRPAGTVAYEMAQLVPSGPSVYEGAVPGGTVTERGVEYWVRVEGTSGVEATVPEDLPAEQPRYASVTVSRMEATRQLRPETYAMVSVPLGLENSDAVETLAGTFGASDPSRWRLLRWDAAEQAYTDFTDPDGNGIAAEFAPGKAYWLITRDGGGFEVTNAESVGREPITLDLEPGWTQLANPRPYPVAWSDVSGIEATSNPVFVPEAGGNAFDFDVSVLEPWTGYWIYNFEPTVAELVVPAREAETEPALRATGETTSAESSSPSQRTSPVPFGTSVAYGMQLKAALEQEDNELLRDTPVAVGVTEGQADLLPRERIVPKPPPIGEYVRLQVIDNGTPLAGSLQAAGGDGHTWDLLLSASQAVVDVRQPVDVEIKTFGEVPPGVEWRLVDRKTGRMLAQGNMTDESVRLELHEEQPERALRLIIGTASYAEQVEGAIKPQLTELHSIYPNPASGPVTVEYQLTEAQYVQITVYNTRGQRVAQLIKEHQPAGAHAVEWDTRLSSRPVSSGVYMVRLKAQDVTDTRQFVIVR